MDKTSSCAEFVYNPPFSMVSSCLTASLFIPECVLRQKYLENYLSTREIAKEFACSKSRIRRFLLKYKIPLRKPSDILVLWGDNLAKADIRSMQGFAATTALLDVARARHLEETLIWQAVRETVDRGTIKAEDEKKVKSIFYGE